MSSIDIDQPQRSEAIALTRKLRTLHKALIDVETRKFGAVGSPLEHLQLITTHPHFAWLQKLSGLMAELDERLDQPEPFDRSTAVAFHQAIGQLIGPGKEIDPAFRAKYSTVLHESPDVVMAHAAVRQALLAIEAA